MYLISEGNFEYGIISLKRQHFTFCVYRICPAAHQPGELVWSSLRSSLTIRTSGTPGERGVIEHFRCLNFISQSLIVCVSWFSHPESPDRVTFIMEELQHQDLLSQCIRVEVSSSTSPAHSAYEPQSWFKFWTSFTLWISILC